MRVLVLSVVLLLACGAAAQQACVVPATISPDSAVIVGGAITQPFEATVTGKNKATFSGNIAIVFPNAKACPTPDNAKAALSTAYVATVKGSSVSVGEATALVKIGDTEAATLTLSGLSGTLSSKAGDAGVGAPTVTATSGQILTKSQLTTVAPYSLSGRKLTFGSGSCSLSVSGATLQYACPTLTINNKFTIEAGSGELKITGKIMAAGKLSDGKLVASSSVPGPN